MHIFLKQTASYFVTHPSSVHAVFLDASKAFDRVLHMKLFEKLIQRKVLLQPLRWCCGDCVIHHERDVREE